MPAAGSFGRAAQCAAQPQHTQFIACASRLQERIEAFHASNTIAPARRRLDEARLRQAPAAMSFS